MDKLLDPKRVLEAISLFPRNNIFTANQLEVATDDAFAFEILVKTDRETERVVVNYDCNNRIPGTVSTGFYYSILTECRHRVTAITFWGLLTAYCTFRKSKTDRYSDYSNNLWLYLNKRIHFYTSLIDDRRVNSVANDDLVRALEELQYPYFREEPRVFKVFTREQAAPIDIRYCAFTKQHYVMGHYAPKQIEPDADISSIASCFETISQAHFPDIPRAFYSIASNLYDMLVEVAKPDFESRWTDPLDAIDPVILDTYLKFLEGDEVSFNRKAYLCLLTGRLYIRVAYSMATLYKSNVYYILTYMYCQTIDLKYMDHKRNPASSFTSATSTIEEAIANLDQFSGSKYYQLLKERS